MLAVTIAGVIVLGNIMLVLTFTWHVALYDFGLLILTMLLLSVDRLLLELLPMSQGSVLLVLATDSWLVVAQAAVTVPCVFLLGLIVTFANVVVI